MPAPGADTPADRHFLRDPFFFVLCAAAAPAALAFYVANQMGLGARFPGHGLMFVLVFPILEELVFRGLVQGSLLRYGELRRRLLGPISHANLVTSLIFAMAHLLRQPLLWAASTLVPSLVFGYVRERYNSVLPAIVLHILYNGAFALAVSS